MIPGLSLAVSCELINVQSLNHTDIVYRQTEASETNSYSM